MLGHTPDEAAQLILKKAREGTATGSRESLQASQKILQEKGASLTRSQTGQANAVEIFGEKLGSSGIVSEQATLRQVQKVNDATREALTDVINRTDMRGGASSTEVGETMFAIIEEGRTALSKSYGDALGEITSKVNNKESSLRPLARDFLENKLKGVLSLPNMSARDFLALDKALSAEVRALRTVGTQTTDPLAAQQLGDAVEVLRDSFVKTLKQADPKAAKEYMALKKTYKESLASLTPKITASTLRAADVGDFDKLGKMLLQGSNVSKTRAFMKSIDEAYVQLGRRGRKDVGELPYANAKEAKEAVKSGYLKGLFKDANDPSFTIDSYANMAAQFNDPQKDLMLRTIVGKDYPRVKQLMNLMNEASRRPDGNIGTLFLRGKEYAAARGLGGGGTGAVAAGSAATGLAMHFFGAGVAAFSLGAVLMTPLFLAKAAANPKVVNRLLAFQKTKFKTSDAMEKAAALIVGDVINGLNEY